MSSISTRKTAAERREEILEAAVDEFAAHGLYGASTDAIARKAGISQPYLFRLFRTKKELFIAVVEQCLTETHETFRSAAEGLHGEEALHAMGDAYLGLVAGAPARLRLQMQGYAACDDADVCAAMRAGYRALVTLAEQTGVPAEGVRSFFAAGMLCNVVTMMGLAEHPEPWAAVLDAKA